MNKLLLSAAIILGLGFSSPLMAQDKTSADFAKRLDMAKEYSKAVPVSEDIDRTIEAIVIRVPVENRAQFRSILNRNIKKDRLESVTEMALAEIFTEAELKTLISFYGSPEGASIREKMPEFQGRITPIMESMIRESIEAMAAQKK